MTRNRKHIVNVVKRDISGRFSFKLYQVDRWNERVRLEIKRKRKGQQKLYMTRKKENASHV